MSARTSMLLEIQIHQLVTSAAVTQDTISQRTSIAVYLIQCLPILRTIMMEVQEEAWTC